MPTEALRKADAQTKPLPYTTVILDIEGTTTPITFVHDVLFPYVDANLEQFLLDHWNEAECVKKVEALRLQAQKDVEEGIEGASPVLEASNGNDDDVCRSVIDNVRWQMSIDRKIGPLKALQGYMWRFAFHEGIVKGLVYDDVVPALQQWKNRGKSMYIYSSGSVEAQKLLFGWSVNGDLLPYFKGHYDTNIGLKVSKDSYTNIARDINENPENILFISDNIKEIDAALKAGFQVAIASRPGNAPLPFPPDVLEPQGAESIDIDGQQIPIIRSFQEIFERTDDFYITMKSERDQFNDLIHLETMFEELGREDGLRDGIQAGYLEGRIAGTGHGFDMTREAGFYGGAADMWIRAAQKGLFDTSDRALKSLERLQAQSADFPLVNGHSEDEPDPIVALDRIRGRYKVAISAIGPYAVGQSYKTDDLDRPVMNF